MLLGNRTGMLEEKKQSYVPFYIESKESGSVSVSLNIVGTVPQDIQWSQDLTNWTSIGTNTLTLTTNDKVYFRNNSTGLNIDNNNYLRFRIERNDFAITIPKIYIGGRLISLYDKNCIDTNEMETDRPSFERLFSEGTWNSVTNVCEIHTIKKDFELPAVVTGDITQTQGIFQQMFMQSRYANCENGLEFKTKLVGEQNSCFYEFFYLAHNNTTTPKFDVDVSELTTDFRTLSKCGVFQDAFRNSAAGNMLDENWFVNACKTNGSRVKLADYFNSCFMTCSGIYQANCKLYYSGAPRFYISLFEECNNLSDTFNQEITIENNNAVAVDEFNSVFYATNLQYPPKLTVGSNCLTLNSQRSFRSMFGQIKANNVVYRLDISSTQASSLPSGNNSPFAMCCQQTQSVAEIYLYNFTDWNLGGTNILSNWLVHGISDESTGVFHCTYLLGTNETILRGNYSNGNYCPLNWTVVNDI